MMQARWDEASAAFEHAYGGLVETVGEQHPYTLTALHFRGVLELERGDAVAALPLLRRAYDSRLQAHGPDHSWVRFSANRVGEALIALGLPDEALELLETSYRNSLRAQGEGHPNVLTQQVTLGRALMAAGRHTQAEILLVGAVELGRHRLPAYSSRLASAEEALAQLRLLQRRRADAYQLLTAAGQRWQRGFGEQHPEAVRIANQLIALGPMVEAAITPISAERNPVTLRKSPDDLR